MRRIHQGHGRCVRSDTPRNLRRAVRGAIAFAFLAVALASCATGARGPVIRTGESLTTARVLLVQGDRLYLSVPDSGTVQPEDLIAVLRGARTLATARVSDVQNGQFAAASIVAGALRGERLDRLRVVVRERPRARVPARLRIGVPGAGRPRAGFTCGEGERFAPPPGFVEAGAGVGARVFVRDTAATVASAWPETLDVVAFADEVDQEIALLRGELDVAVFWPGEPSVRLREGPSWDSAWLARPMHGVIALWQGTGSATGTDWVAPAVVNRERFHGDLAEVPAWNARSAPRGADDPGRLAWRYLDAPSTLPADSIGREAPAITIPMFAVRCPVVSAPRVHAAVEAIGPERFADLLRCPQAPR